MSLLMDALRKAEEAKKQAAQENKSDETAPAAVTEKQQASPDVGKGSEDNSAPKVKLSMETMEEVSIRSGVPNLKPSDEFDDEDEEDFVLPTSVGAEAESAAESDTNLEQSLSSEDEPSDGLEKNKLDAEKGPEASAMASVENLDDLLVTLTQEKEQEPKVEPETFDFDSFENEEDDATTNEGAVPDAAIVVAPVSKKSGNEQGPRKIVKVAEQAREQARDRDGPGRKTARRVFAAKKSPLLQNPKIRIAAGGTLALSIVAFATYFYISLTQESEFNIPVGSFATSEFVDEGSPAETGEDQLSLSAVTTTEVEEVTAVNLAAAVPEQSRSPGNVEVNTGDVSVAATVEDAFIEPQALEIVAVPEVSPSAANLQPETIVEELPQPETVATSTSDTSVVVVEPYITAQSQPMVEPTSLISFRKQETVATVNPNVDRAYAAYQQGSLDQAEALYRQTLTSDPGQRDALLGLANITARKGNSTEALDLYSRLLARNPSDPIARAGLMELLPASSPTAQEAELRRLLNDHPNVAALSYAYGNFLASNQRWSEAQQAYFRALQLAKSDVVLNGLVNPDYAFNLAVSLEHLNQSEPAQNYYREALNYSANHPAGFDLAAVRSRLANMAGSSNNE